MVKHLNLVHMYISAVICPGQHRVVESDHQYSQFVDAGRGRCH
jgi:hypothetical protein